MLSFEIRRSEAASDELDVVCDREGLESLLAQLRLLQLGKTDHVHLMAESWGGTHLDEDTSNPSSSPIRHVKVLLR
jgi:hypothetical protein